MKRYDGYNLVPTMNGAWVKHEDVEALEKQLAEANEIIKGFFGLIHKHDANKAIEYKRKHNL